MLKIIELGSLTAKKTIWEEFEKTVGAVWLVSDLKSKIFLSDELLEKRGILVEQPVKRASEFWRELFRESAPAWRVLSEIGTQALAKSFLSKQSEVEWAHRPFASIHLIQVSKILAPLIMHPEATNVMKEFFKQMPESWVRWGKTAELSRAFYTHCEKEKSLPGFFVPMWLSQQPQLPRGRPLFVDLNVQLTSVERELFHRLSELDEVTVLVPTMGQEEISHKSSLAIYKDLGFGKAKVQREKRDQKSPHLPKPHVARSSNLDAEARWAVSVVKKWIQSGVKASEICIAAQDIDQYMPSLLHDLSWEGVGLRRERTRTWLATKFFRIFMAKMRVTLGELNSDLLQEAYFHSEDMKFSKRRAQLQKRIRAVQKPQDIYDKGLQNRILKIFSKAAKEEMNLSAFEEMVMFVVGDMGVDVSSGETRGVLVRALQVLREEMSEQRLAPQIWVEALEGAIRRQDQVIHAESPQGIFAVDLQSVEEVPATHLIVLGLTEEAEISAEGGFLSDADIGKLQAFGFDIAKPRSDRLELTLKWLITRAWKQVYFSAPGTDGQGRSIAAHRMWIDQALKQGRALEDLDHVEGLEFQKVQRHLGQSFLEKQLSEIKKWPSEKPSLLMKAFETENKKERVVQVTSEIRSLSASRIEDFFQCPFISMAKNVLKLEDEPEIDLEPSPQDRGAWLHEAVEELLKREVPLEEWDARALESLLDGTVDLEKIGDQSFWPSHRARFLRQLERFLEIEREWRRKFPKVKTLGLEEKIQGFLLLQGEKLKFTHDTKESGAIPFSGKIDRIDAVGEKVAIIDYKNSETGLKDIKGWAKHGEFQLPLYAMAVEAGLTAHGPKKVLAAVYYILRRVKRDRGFRVQTPEAHELTDFEGLQSSVIESLEERDQYFEGVQKGVAETVRQMQAGDFTPKPHDTAQCNRCSWRSLCRAKHLL